METKLSPIQLSDLPSDFKLRPGQEMMSITQERLKELLSYDPHTGVFTWKKQQGRAKAGGGVGSKHSRGYLTVRIYGKSYLLHRLAWFYSYGYFPNQIDHINQDRTDNRLANLRDVDNQENNKNQSLRSTNTSGIVGVVWNKDVGKWQAQIVVSGRCKSLGLFKTKLAAAYKRHIANIEYGFSPNHGMKK